MSVSFNANRAAPAPTPRSDRARQTRGRTAVEQARLVLLVMINVAQLWILSATVEAALARELRHLLPLVVASFVCFVITLTLLLWWRPVSRRPTSTGYVREARRK
jgi:cytochrome bd-type quinol oxidase subunit 2